MPNSDARPRTATAAWSLLASGLLLVAAACSAGAPATGSPQGTPTPGTQPSTAPPATATPISTVPPAVTTATPGGAITTFTLVMGDGPKMGTWEVTYSGEVAGCSYLPNLDRWIATWLGPPPLTFIDVTGDDDPFFMFAFDGNSPEAIRFLPTGEVTFEVDDRGDTATLTFVSETNNADYDDGSPAVDFGPAELTIECGSIFRYP